ncbi:MAG: hypothetical protein ACOC6J_09215 [Spirochaetota bacterium]
MTPDDLKRKLRDLRRLERRVRGLSDGEPTDVWRRYFSLSDGSRVRYPFAMLVAFDRDTRERVFREYLVALWAHSGEGARGRVTEAGGDASSADEQLLGMLGLGADADAADVRSAFRRLALEIHPDAGGDDSLMRELIEKYRASAYGGGHGR